MTSGKEETGSVIVESARKTSTMRPRGAMTNAGWNAFRTIWGIGISFVIASLLIHNLGAAQYGILLLVWSVTGVLGLLNFGFGEATLRYVAYHFGAGNISGVNRVMGSTLSFYSIICLVVCAGFFLTAPVLVALFSIPAGEHRLFGWLLRLSPLLFSLTLLSGIYGVIPEALQRYDINSKIGVVQSVVRSGGYVILALCKFGLLQLIFWDLITATAALWVQIAINRKIAPGVSLLPALSFQGLREIWRFSLFSFLGFLFYVMYRESGKMTLGTLLGPSPVAYLGTPDNVALRLYSVVSSGSESLMPRFSANRDPRIAQRLFWNATWSCLVISLVFFLPLVVLLPDFLRLWISPEFARESATLGQLVALSYIPQGAYAATSTFFRGTGKPWLVAIVTFFSGVTTLVFSLILVPRYGILGVGYAYLLGSVPSLLGLLHGWFYAFGAASAPALMRSVGLPLVLAAIAFVIENTIRGCFAQLTWCGLFTLGGLFTTLTGLLIIGADWSLGGVDAPSKQFLRKLHESDRITSILRYFRLKRV
jgi:O-antigen/teichoic acid export membrane protein